MDATGLETIYRRYLEVLNERRWADLDEFVHEHLVYNHEPLTRGAYCTMIAANVEAIPDLHFTIDLLVVQNDLVACRLAFDCTLQHEIFGLRPTGESVSFAEHVIYRFRDRRIAEVWSLIDKQAIEAQFTS